MYDVDPRQGSLDEVDAGWFGTDEGTLPIGAPFRPGLDPLPAAQHAWAVVKDRWGRPAHGEPRVRAASRDDAGAGARPRRGARLRPLRRAHVQHDLRRPRRADLGVRPPRSRPARAGQRRGGAGGRARHARPRARAGSRSASCACSIPGVSDLLSPRAGEDPMHADFKIQGYETPDGSFTQFVRCQAPQLLAHSERLTLPEALVVHARSGDGLQGALRRGARGLRRARVRRGRGRRHRALRGRLRRRCAARG